MLATSHTPKPNICDTGPIVVNLNCESGGEGYIVSASVVGLFLRHASRCKWVPCGILLGIILCIVTLNLSFSILENVQHDCCHT